MAKVETVTTVEMCYEYLARIAQALEYNSDLLKKQLEAYDKQNHETLIIMAKREDRDLEQYARIKERHEWDREMHQAMMKSEKQKQEFYSMERGGNK